MRHTDRRAAADLDGPRPPLVIHVLRDAHGAVTLQTQTLRLPLRREDRELLQARLEREPGYFAR